MICGGVVPERRLSEGDTMRQIMIALSADGHAVFRANVGLFYTRDGRPVSTGLPPGFSDLFGFTPQGRAFFLEIKSPAGRLRPEQAAFLDAMKKRGALAGVARNVQDAKNILQS